VAAGCEIYGRDEFSLSL
jgi:hypothetical protein